LGGGPLSGEASPEERAMRRATRGPEDFRGSGEAAGFPFPVCGLFSGAPGDKPWGSGGRPQGFFPGLSLDIHNPDNSLLPDQLRGSVPGGEEARPTLGEVLLKPRFLHGQGPPPDTPRSPCPWPSGGQFLRSIGEDSRSYHLLATPKSAKKFSQVVCAFQFSVFIPS